MMLRTLIFSFLFSASLLAQTVSVPANEDFSVAWDHSGVSTNEYRVEIDSSAIGTVPVGTSPYSFDVVGGLPVGQHTIDIYAVNQFGDSAPGNIIAEFGNPPSESPTNITITITITVP